MSFQDSRDPGPIPNRWLHCPRKATDLIVGKFLAFKCPLSEKFDAKVPPVSRFHPEMLLDFCKKKKLKMGLWIDLTNTNRFYDKDVLRDYDCTHVKLQCVGHGETPSEEQTNVFINMVRNFISQHPLHCIGVHCTHGFNRTGFLIVSYLVQEMDMNLPVALDTFARARPPGIYKADYLEELYKRHDDIDDVPPPPELPNWYYDEPEEGPNSSSDTEQPQTSSSLSQPEQKQRQRRRNGKQAEFMVNLPGIDEFTEQPKAFKLKKQVQMMCGWKGKDFPGAQPVSMDTNNIEFLSQKPYRVSWKADGTRYMMLIDGPDEVYFFDRDFNIFQVRGLRFPERKDLNSHLSHTLLDGEMVTDKVGGENIYRYLAYDIIQFKGEHVGKFDFFPTRLQMIENEIIKPRYEAIFRELINKTKEPISVRNKQFWEITQAASLMGEKFAASLSHEPDGLIFQPSKERYIPGRCDDVLKWKPLDMNSIDFRLKIVQKTGDGLIPTKIGALYVGKGNNDAPFAHIKYSKQLKDLDGKIIECKLEKNEWKFMRERKDKSYPNGINTANAVLGSIRNPITKEYLLNYIDKFRFKDDGEIMPPPNKRVRR